MTLSESLIYRRIAPLLIVCALVLAIGAVTGTYVNDRADRRRDHAITEANSARIQDNADLLACFDKFATALAGGLPPVRDASAARDDARAAWEDASNAVSKAIEAALARAASGQPVDGSQVPVILGAFHDLDTASAALHKANTNLDQVRAANPYPPPPSTFCTSS